MGFSDEGGWLTQLCSTKRGNMEEILDVLAPVRSEKISLNCEKSHLRRWHFILNLGYVKV